MLQPIGESVTKTEHNGQQELEDEMKASILYKLNQIARLRLFSGLKDYQIAQLLGLSQGGFSRIISLPEYQEEETRQLNGGISKLDEALAGKQEEMKKAFQVGVPMAMRTLMEAVQQRRDLRSAIAASVELLDRDPERTFVKPGKGVAESPTANIPGSVLAAALSATNEVAKSVAASAKVPVVIQPANADSN